VRDKYSEDASDGGNRPSINSAVRSVALLLQDRDRCRLPVPERFTMTTATAHEIAWRHDFDRAVEDAKQQKKLILLDFSAAPM
jgi:hypothetical protein